MDTIHASNTYVHTILKQRKMVKYFLQNSFFQSNKKPVNTVEGSFSLEVGELVLLLIAETGTS